MVAEGSQVEIASVSRKITQRNGGGLRGKAKRVRRGCTPRGRGPKEWRWGERRGSFRKAQSESREGSRKGDESPALCFL